MAKLRSLFLSNRGLTLLEIVLALAMLGIISLIISSILMYGLRVTRMGTELREEHQEVILLSDVIDNEIRYAYEVQIISNVNTDNIDRTLYLTDDDVRQYDGASNINIAEDSISIVEFTIILEPVSSPERAFLDYRIVGIDGYEVNSRILLLNVNPEDLIHNSSGSIITYDYVGNGRR